MRRSNSSHLREAFLSRRKEGEAGQVLGVGRRRTSLFDERWRRNAAPVFIGIWDGCQDEIPGQRTADRFSAHQPSKPVGRATPARRVRFPSASATLSA